MSQSRAGVGSGYVTVAMCDRWTERYESTAGLSTYDIAEDVGVPRSTVRDHVTGECKHAPAQRGVHEVRDSEDRQGVIEAIGELLDRNFGDTIYVSARRVRKSVDGALATQKARTVLGDLADQGQAYGLAVRRHNPGSHTARYAITRAEGGEP